jgi:hypothetical protein
MVDRRRAIRLAACMLVATAIIAACGESRSDDGAEPTEGPARPFLMGFSSLPRELNSDAYRQAIEFADQHGDMVLIQRTLPWDEFVPGSSVSDDTASNTVSERDAVRDADLELFFAIDLTDGATGRDRLADLPVSLEGKNFADEDVRAAVISYAEYVAINYQPEYLAIGVDMNLYYERNKEDFENFLTLYRQARATVQSQSPDTQVTTTMQYEDLLGVMPREDMHFPSWHIVRALEPDLDVFSVSTYPSFAFGAVSEMPDDYYTQISAYVDKPVVIAEMGFSSDAGDITSGSEAEQEAFVRRALADAEAINMRFVIWFAIWDPAYALETAYSPFAHIGLRRGDDTEKPAWTPWSQAARRPVAR